MVDRAFGPMISWVAHPSACHIAKEKIIKLYEHEGKKIFAQNGIPVPNGVFVERDGDFAGAADLGWPCMVKAQILQGGRGKAGGIKAAGSLDEAQRIAREMWAKPLKNEALAGVLIEERIAIERELYLGVTIDDVIGKPLLILCAEGGMEIEAVARDHPEKLHKRILEPERRLDLYEAVEICQDAGLHGELLLDVAKTILGLESAFHQMDAILAEINPLVVTPEGKVVAGDAKIVIDGYAESLHPEIPPRQSLEADEDEFERMAKEKDFILVRLGGDIGVISAGAGFGMAIVDTIDHFGGKAANFADQMGGKPFFNTIDGILSMIDRDKSIKSAVWGFVLSATSLASLVKATVKSLSGKHCRVPVHGYFRGGSAALQEMGWEEAKKEMADTGITMHESLRDAIKAAVADAKRGEALT